MLLSRHTFPLGNSSLVPNGPLVKVSRQSESPWPRSTWVPYWASKPHNYQDQHACYFQIYPVLSRVARLLSIQSYDCAFFLPIYEMV